MPLREHFRYFSILDGANLTNEDETTTSPRYYGYTRPGGSYIIMQRLEDTGTFIYEFHVNSGPQTDITQYNTDWTNRASLTYVKSGTFKRL